MEIFHFNTNLQLDVRYERSEKNFAEENELDRVFKCRRQLPSESSFYEKLPKVLNGYVLLFIYITVTFNLIQSISFETFPKKKTAVFKFLQEEREAAWPSVWNVGLELKSRSNQ